MQPLKLTAACLFVNTRAGRRRREVRGPTGQRSDAVYYSRGRWHLDRITSEKLASLTTEVNMSWICHYTSWWHFSPEWGESSKSIVSWCTRIFYSLTKLENRSSVNLWSYSDDILPSLIYHSTHSNNGSIAGFNGLWSNPLLFANQTFCGDSHFCSMFYNDNRSLSILFYSILLQTFSWEFLHICAVMCSYTTHTILTLLKKCLISLLHLNGM